ncbi:MAG: hypothetical protein KKD39_04265, partial [Candidatus Altiarchaeota archaeon]|nr:hypothetical protein [Candidatus Altiarchaeota archaeon]
EEEKAKKEELKRKMREKGATTLKIPQIKKQPDDVKPLIIQGENPGADDKTPVKKVQEGKKVETTIDRFYQTIKKEEHLKINDLLSKKLKIDRTKLEQWSLILEEHNLVELHYPAIGEPEAIYVKKKGNDGGEAGDGKKG